MLKPAVRETVRDVAGLFAAIAIGLFIVALLATPGRAVTQSPSVIPCHVTATQADGPGVQLHGSCISPVSVAVWLAPSLSGNPITVQTLFWSAAVNGVDGTAYVPIILPSGGEADCFVQVDVAYGAPSIPYGPRLIAAWHTGTRDCLTPPTSSPPPTTSPPVTTTPPVTSTPPVSSPPATTTVPPTTEPPVTTPPATTTVPPTVPPTTTPVVIPPPTSFTRSPTPSTTTPRKVHRTTVPPPPSASGCVASGCVTPPPTPPTPPTLPFTGSQTAELGAAGGIALAAGIGLVTVAHRRRTARNTP